MSTDTHTVVFHWEQNSDGSDSGLATFTFLEGDVSVKMYSLAEAFILQKAIEKAVFEARYDGRASMLRQINQMKP